ncbi:MAG: sensor histidine kinase N-terminal domain-containing protein [Limnohabitans sp.]|nr:sensor histidine kinase N-terminal domain-containing protein [Limnohabitans sp.]MDP4772806.1 sensor histidine kinase N-terminal domain-containing protein [Limnohabitans sp.]MDP4923621.1 sensor histidine kinase N-terminal domain-containing protein [Limnohabitans sp.]
MSQHANRVPQHVASLRRRLLGWILLPLAGLIGINAWVAYGNAVQAANEAYDRSLYLAARTLAEELEWRDGRVQLDMMKAAGFLFENHTGSRLFYKVETPTGRWLAGVEALPDVPVVGQSAVKYFALVQFDDGVYLNQPVRLAQLTHVMEDADVKEPLLKITVAETMEARQQLIQSILWDTLGSQGLLLLAAALLVLWGVQRGIRPLEVFRQQLARKADDDFSPIHPPDLPRELRPLIATLNSYLDRLGRLIDIRKRFLDNAAHQLRTPLTALKTQLALVQRNAEPEQSESLLMAARQTTDDAVRLTEQLLAMTRVEHAREMHSPHTVDLVDLARRVTQEHLMRAHQLGDDLGLEVQVAQCEVQGVDLLLHEALSNLIDNAIHHGPVGTHITVRVGEFWLEVEDDGPGIAPEHQAHVFERFYRAAPSGVNGSGLGLAIVKEIANQHGAVMQVTSPVEKGCGALIRMSWPQD